MSLQPPPNRRRDSIVNVTLVTLSDSKKHLAHNASSLILSFLFAACIAFSEGISEGWIGKYSMTLFHTAANLFTCPPLVYS